MKIKQYISLFVVLGSLLLLAACGSSGGSGGDQTASPADDLGSDVTTGIDYVGTATCIGCHEDFSWSAEIVANYLEGKHVVNYAGSDHYGYDYMVANNCDSCHDPVGDSPELSELLGAEHVTMGCENCHGAGGNHYGVGPMPVATPDSTVCAKCHDEVPAIHLEHHAEGNFIASEFASSAHASSLDKPYFFVEGSTTDVNARCAKCHSDQGAKLYKDTNGGYDDLAHLLLPDGTPPVQDATPIQCQTCHDAHNPSQLLMASTATASAEFRTCTNCHQLSDSYHGENSSHSWDSGEVGVGEFTGASMIIYDTHFDDATTAEIEGYNIDPTNERACRDCHNVHSGALTINEQWATSGHAGELSAVKEAADASTAANINTAAVTDAAFTYYDFVNEGWTAECLKCHTSTGSRNYLSDPANYDPANNDFTYLEEGQREMVYCWACHSDNSGGLLNLGTIPLDYTVDGEDATLTAPDGNSAACLSCHSGLGNMNTLLKGREIVTATPAATEGYEIGGTLTHYLTAGAIINQSVTKVGYTYGLEYKDPDSYAHGHITLGCAECHMESSDSHSFNVVTENDLGDPVIKSTTCIECHTGKYSDGIPFVSAEQLGETIGVNAAFSDTVVDTVITQDIIDSAGAKLEEEAEGYHEALSVLAEALSDQGITPLAYYPYFGGDDPVNEGQSGAMHNYSLLHHEPGAYAHNRYYAKRLIFDSIDWLDNGVLNGVINIDAATYADAAHWLGAAKVADATAVPPVAIGDANRP